MAARQPTFAVSRDGLRKLLERRGGKSFVAWAVITGCEVLSCDITAWGIGS